jgi:hypothetical protein
MAMPCSCVQLPALANDAGAEAAFDDDVTAGLDVVCAAAVAVDDDGEVLELWLVPPQAASRLDETTTAATILGFIADSWRRRPLRAADRRT